MTDRRAALGLLLALATLVQAACAIRQVSSGVVQYFDEDTGATVVALAEPLIFAAEAPFLAANARDYVYLGPVEVSRGGEKSHFLWLAEWSSIDRQVPAADGDEQSVLVLLLDGEPMELTAPPSGNRLPRSGHSPYVTPVGSPAEHVFALTRQQLIRIARAKVISVESVRPDVVRNYTGWRAERAPLQIFARYLESGDEAALQFAAYGQ